MQPMLNIAIRAARAAGNIIIRHIDHIQDLLVSTKGRNDFVTEVDRQAEAIIIDTIHKAYPNHAILAEESGPQGNNDYQWIIDPLDGTTNFLHGFPQFAVSIALQHKGVLTQAVVYDPLRQELFTSSRGDGAYLNDRRIRVSRQKYLEGALLGTGFPFKEQQRFEQYLDTFRALSSLTAGIRRAGSAALDLAYVACGRLDGFWEFGLEPWDIAAGALLIEEAGGMISDISGEEDYLNVGDILCGNPQVYKDLVKVLVAPQVSTT
ncbi:MAG: Inositol-1-monophosphatase [Gammaproteobacteria bacterium]|nr:Inositol-1-monophosphatase [Gammaproteobacteria bacterium]